jgi:hypothetical protein
VQFRLVLIEIAQAARIEMLVDLFELSDEEIGVGGRGMQSFVLSTLGRPGGSR